MANQKDEIGRSGIYPAGSRAPDDAAVITPGAINEGRTGSHRRSGPGVERNEDLEGAERLPRKGNEEDKPFDDRLTD